MKKASPWLGVGLIAASLSGSSFACSSDDSEGGGGGGTGGGLPDGSGAFGATGGSGGSGATGGTGGTGGTAATTKLAKACVNDGECGGGLTCILPDSGKLDGEGPAHGYCSATCAVSEDCKAHDPKGECNRGWCFAGCTIGEESQKKCQGRPDVGCNLLLESTPKGACTGANKDDCPAGEMCAADGMCHDTFSMCDPRCGSDSDCPAAHTCNLDTGLCTTKAAAGKDLGESCQATPPGQCKGLCIGISPSQERFCSNWCVLGAPGCGFTAVGVKSDGICSLIFDLGGAAPTTGDIGACQALCDCNAHCAPGYLCVPNANATQANRVGACSPTANVDAGAGIAICPDDGGTDAGTGGTDAGTGGTDAGTGGTDAGTGGTGTGGAPADAANG